MENGNDKTKVYSKSDFIEGTTPFEEVYSFIDDPFELDRQVEKMSEIARMCGVKNFKTLFKGYCKKMKIAKNQTYVDNSTNFDGQELELATGPWRADDYGITREGAYGSEIVACVHPIMPVERLVNIDTGIEKLRIAYRKGRQWRNMIFDRKQLASASSIVGLSDYGVAVTSENAKFLVQYIHDIENLNYELIPEHNSVSRLGWIGRSDFSPYVDDLIFDGDISFKHLYDSVSPKGDPDEWIRFVKDIRAKGNVPTKIVLAASFASVLVEPCNSSPFFVHLWNGSGNGKTVALMLAASVWANPRVGEYISTFNSTAVGQELSAGFVNSLPLILDELQIQNGNRKDFDGMIYKLAEGAGRSRGAKTGGLQKKATWRNCILTSGESPITSAHSGAGAVNRIIEINTEGTKFFRNAKKTADFLTENYGHAGRMFVEKLREPGAMDFARDAQKQFFETLSNEDITEKQVLAASLILTADVLIDTFIFKDGNGLRIDELSQFLSTHSEVSSDVRAYEWLIDWIAQNSKRFDADDDMPETWGRMDMDKISIIKNVFNKACSDNGYSPSSFLSWLKRNDMIETEGRAYTKRVRLNGMRCQCVILKRDTVPGGIKENLPDGFEMVPENEQVEF
ncbi:MAG: DUF927 domain-containing protein [Clostridiales bacterium]|nr:DUF927 domain-containing protein [Clostridiales bacterium]